MIILVLVVVGVCLGSFVNALVWRLHEQARETSRKKPNTAYLKQLSISRGRSMCPQCHHELAPKDLIPVISWLSLGGKCRYCRKPIGDSPLVELATSLLFVFSYLAWPQSLQGTTMQAQFVLWLLLLVGFMALAVYDLRWMLLPNRLVYPLTVLGGSYAILNIATSDKPINTALNTLAAVVVGGGIFYLLFQLSAGKWIGGGDVKLGWLLGLIVATPARSLLVIFIAALAGSLASVPLLVNGRLRRNAQIPFGPFLILGAVIVVLFGTSILHWYQQLLVGPH